ncbi:MAG TPA: diadenylate cyclase CdaA [Clostridiaceae bacterium]
MFSDLLGYVTNSIKVISPFSILDILVVTYIFYKSYMLIKETRAEQLLKGIILIGLIIPISNFLHLDMLMWLLNKTITIGVLSIVIIFQPEIRKALERIGRNAFNERHIFDNDVMVEKLVSEICTAAEILSEERTGALIVVEQNTGLADIVDTGIKLDALVSSALLRNIFVVNTPLHDGATIIRDDRIIASGCFLPLTEESNINSSLGTRHRAAIGLSEISDAIIVIVSEETGIMSLAVNGRITRNYDRDRLKDIMIRIIKNRNKKRLTFGEKVKGWLKIFKSTG